MRFPRSLSILAAVFAALLPTYLQSQVSAVAPRVAGPVDESSRVSLQGNISGVARSDFDRGEAAPSAQMRQVRLVLSRSPEQKAALDKLMAEQIDKSSPNYQHWLTPEEFNRQFGVADSDLAAIHAWLESHGLTVDTRQSDHTSVAFSGTVSQIEDAFHARIHAFEGNGQSYLANVSDPQIPAALASVVSGVARLNTFQPLPHMMKAPAGMLDSASGQFTPVDQENFLVRPEITFSNSRLYVTAADAATIYNTPNKYNSAFSGTSYTGQGVTIGIGGQNAINTSVVQNYRSLFLGDTKAPTITNIGSVAVVGGATDEAYLDVELSGAMAPGATIHFYTSGDGVFSVIQPMLTDNSVDIFSLSFGLCEYFFTKSDNQQIAQMWQQAATQGIAVTVSTGDDAAAGCDNQNDPTVTTASYGLQVNGLASTPYNIAVGGTDFHGLLNGGFSTYVNAGGGNAANFYRTAKSYIPESTWNNSITSDGLLSANQPNTTRPNIVGGSGGVSACSNNTTTRDSGGTHPGTCSGGYAKPSWQRGTGVPSDGKRDLPDISLFGGNGYDGAAWLVCSDYFKDTDSGSGQLEDCSNHSGTFYFTAYGGTSTSAPAFAGMLALVQEKNGGGGQAHRLGLNGAKALYDLFNGSHAAAVFHEATGNISVPCGAGTPNCAMNTAGFNFLTGYDTGTGYDLATGLGTVDATALVNFWGNATGSSVATVTATPTPATITVAQSVTINVTVSGASGTPTGSVSLTGGGYTSTAATLDGTGKASIVIPAHSLNTGSDTLTISYTGDPTYSSATGTTSVTVTALPVPTVTVTPASSTIVVNQTLGVTIAVSGTAGTATGTVTLSNGTGAGTYNSGAIALTNGSASITIPANALTVGTDTLTASYSGNASYATASGTASVTVNPKPTPTVTVTPASTTITTDQSLDVTVKVTGSGATPTGNVTITGGGYTSAAKALAAGSATISIPASTFTSTGSVTLTANYVGDSVYAAGSGTAALTVNAPYSVSIPTQPPAVSKGAASDVTVSFKTDGVYTGTVAVSCSLTGQPSGAQNLPSCSISAGSSLTFSAATTTGSATAHITTTAATTANLERHGLPGWLGASGGSALALLVFFGIPARRRSWRNLLGLIVVLATLGTLSGCGGGGGNGGGGGGGNPGTTAGTYTFTVTGTGTPAITPAPKTTITLTVN